MKGKANHMLLSPKQRSEVLARIKKAILKHHFNAGGVSYEAWAARFDSQMPQLLTSDADGFENGVRQLLLELGSSHTVFYHQSATPVLPQHSINATLRRVTQAGTERWFFLDVFKDGPAHRAGIKPGDVLVAVDGVPYTPPSMPSLRTGQTCTLTISNIQGADQREIRPEIPHVKATKGSPPLVEPKSPVHAMLSPGVGLLKIAYFPGAMGMRFAEALDAAIWELKQQGCDRLIVDLRGNIGGGLGLARLASYLCPGQIPIGHSLTRRRLSVGYDRQSLPPVPMPRSRGTLLLTLARFAFRDKSVVLLTQGLGKQPFHGRVVVLVNEWTNSAAEMVAGFARENALATLVGSKTAGNVLGAANCKVGSGYWLRLPIFGWYSSRGECLEGKGVSPDVVVDVEPTLLHAGVDQVMDKALEIL
jgi:C-terminal processing protease CtpA/Prc